MHTYIRDQTQELSVFSFSHGHNVQLLSLGFVIAKRRKEPEICKAT